MKKILLPIISLCFIVSSAMAQQTTITKFEGQKIKGLIVGGALDVKLVQGSASGVSVEVSAQAAEKLTIELTDEGYLRLSYGSDAGKFFTSQKNRPTARVTVSELNYLHISGVSNVIGSESFSSSVPFVMTVSGASFCSFVNIKSSGSNISVSNAANVENLTVTDSGKLSVEVTGSSKLDIGGTAADARLAVSGTAQLGALKLTCPTIQVSATGTSLAKVNVTGTADVTTGGLGAVKYIGNGKIVGSGAQPL